MRVNEHRPRVITVSGTVSTAASYSERSGFNSSFGALWGFPQYSTFSHILKISTIRLIGDLKMPWGLTCDSGLWKKTNIYMSIEGQRNQTTEPSPPNLNECITEDSHEGIPFITYSFWSCCFISLMFRLICFNSKLGLSNRPWIFNGNVLIAQHPSSILSTLYCCSCGQKEKHSFLLLFTFRFRRV